MEKRRKWEGPKLIVLVRGARQEGILHSCKQGNSSGASDTYHAGCIVVEGGKVGTCLGNCLSRSSS